MKLDLTVADPGFPRGGDANHKGWGVILFFWQIFLKNCMEMNKFESRERCASLASPWIRQCELLIRYNNHTLS